MPSLTLGHKLVLLMWKVEQNMRQNQMAHSATAGKLGNLRRERNSWKLLKLEFKIIIQSTKKNPPENTKCWNMNPLNWGKIVYGTRMQKWMASLGMLSWASSSSSKFIWNFATFKIGSLFATTILQGKIFGQVIQETCSSNGFLSFGSTCTYSHLYY